MQLEEGVQGALRLDDEPLPGRAQDLAALGAPQAGLFMPNVTDYTTWLKNPEGGWLTNMAWWDGALTEHEGKGFKPANCVAAHPEGSTYHSLCASAGFALQYIKAPLFFIENQACLHTPRIHLVLTP